MSMLKTQRARVIRQRGFGDSRSLSPVSTMANRVDDFQDLVAPVGWPELANYDIPSMEFRENLPISTISMPQQEARSAVIGEISKKRKANNETEMKSKVRNSQSKSGKNSDKRIKQCIEEDEGSKITTQTETSKQNSKVSVKKSDYVHVRARRGQATDSHSLAERARREKISERMKYLQNLVPGCSKIAGKAGMLDEIINYVQSLQQQVEFLSMKLGTVNPRLEFIHVDDLFSKQGNLHVLPTIKILPETVDSSSYISQQTPLMNSTSPFELCSTWGGDLQNLYNMSIQQGESPLLSSPSFSSQQYSVIENENETSVIVPF